jgi:hypothetical protein
MLKCDEHSFFPGSKISITKAHLGCKECAAAEIWYQVATAPPHKRLELFDMMEAAIHHMCEAQDRGEIGFVAFETPIIEIEHDAN